MRLRRIESGFSLLEVIVVLAISGAVLVAYTNYARKQAAKEMRQTTANALVQEMKGVVNYLNDDELQTQSGEVDNPFYEAVNQSTTDARYRNRITNAINDINTENTNNYFLWGDGVNAQSQQRYFFISKKCRSTLKSEFELTKEYLPCSLMTAANNSVIKIDRIGFAADDLKTPSSTIARMDVILAAEYSDSEEKFGFANYTSAFNNALNNNGLIASHIMVVQRARSSDSWQLATKADGSTPIELAEIASNLNRLETVSSGKQLGLRFTFDMNDNTSGGSGGSGASKCWNTKQSKVELCYTQNSGTGLHGEDQILSLDMTDPSNSGDEVRTGTLKANIVMENTARPVYIFKRSLGGSLSLSSAGEPERFIYKDNNSEAFEGDFYLGESNSYRPWNGDSMTGGNIITDYYLVTNYDGFELITPSITEYSGFETLSTDITNRTNFTPVYDEDSKTGKHRFYIQSCPKVKQDIILRDADGNALLNSDGSNKKVSVMRELYPHLSASISSISAYSSGGDIDMYTTEDDTRKNISDREKVDMLGGVTVQVEFAQQDSAHGGTAPAYNVGGKLIYPNAKYLWVVTATMGMYDSDTGKGVNIENPRSIAYTLSKWCSSIPQSGTPYDLLTTEKYR